MLTTLQRWAEEGQRVHGEPAQAAVDRLATALALSDKIRREQGTSCRTCGGAAHPATGCQYTPRFIVCGPCAREFWQWLVKHTNTKGRRNGGPSFYDHVVPTCSQ